MIFVQFQQRTDTGYETVATLRVPDRGEPVLTGALVDELVQVPIPDAAAPGGRLWFDNDPAAWARRCRAVFRTPYLLVKVDETPST